MFALFPIPGMTYFIVVMSYMMGNFLKAFLISAFFSWTGAILCFLLVRFCLKGIVGPIIRKNKLFRVLQDEVKEHPWKASTMLSLLIIPAFIKHYILAISDVTFI